MASWYAALRCIPSTHTYAPLLGDLILPIGRMLTALRRSRGAPLLNYILSQAGYMQNLVMIKDRLSVSWKNFHALCQDRNRPRLDARGS
jgi:hypothetical protein